MTRIDPATHMGAVHLSVSDLERSLDYYRESIGLELLAREAGEARLGAGGRELLRLLESPGARPADGYSGLFHFALLVPERADLARWLAHAARGAGSAHRRLRSLRQRGALPARSRPSRHRDLLRSPARALGGAGVARMGDLAARPRRSARRAPRGARRRRSTRCRPARAWATCTCGSPRSRRRCTSTATCRLRPDGAARRQAAFLTAGGYHHHIGGNTWESRGAAPAPEGTRPARAVHDRRPGRGRTCRGVGASRRRRAFHRSVGERLRAGGLLERAVARAPCPCRARTSFAPKPRSPHRSDSGGAQSLSGASRLGPRTPSPNVVTEV